MMRRIFIMAILFTLIIVTACSGGGGSVGLESSSESPSDSPSGKSADGRNFITIGMAVPPQTLSPINYTHFSVERISSIMFQPLVDLDEDSQQFVPMLAESIETADNQTFVVKLNPDAKWTDGNPVTADDLIFTVRLLGHPEVVQSVGSILSIVEGFQDNGRLHSADADLTGVKKVDDHTVEFKTKNPTDLDMFKEKIGKSIKALPKHILESVNPATLHQHPFMQEPNVSNGPFKLAVNQAQYLEFEANKEYFKGAPKLDKLFFRIMPEPNLVTQLKSGDIDMNFPGAGGNIPIEDTETVMKMPEVVSTFGKPLAPQVLFFNVNSVTDSKVRQAIAYGINRNMIVENLLRGNAEISDYPYTSVHPYFNKDLNPYTYDPEKARNLLQEANWDSSRTLKLLVPTGNITRENAATLIVENLRSIGVKVEIQKADTGTIIQATRKGEFDMLIFAISYIRDPDVSTYFRAKDGSNFSGYSNPAIEELLSQGISYSKPDERRPIYQQIQEKIMQDLPQITLYAENRLQAKSTRVKVGQPKELGMFINVHEWEVGN